jgi:hypothetical protein
MVAGMTPEQAAALAVVAFAGVFPFAGAVTWMAGWVLHGLGRSTAPALSVALIAGSTFLGAMVTLSLGYLQSDPSPATAIDVGIAVVCPAAVAIWLMAGGRRRAAGLVLVGSGLPWTTVMTIYLVANAAGDSVDPVTTILSWLCGLAVVLIGGWLAALGDPAYEPDSAASPDRPGSRQPGALTRALFSAATYGRPSPALIVAVPVVLVVTLVSGMPLVGAVAGTAALVAGTEIQVRWLPPSIRPALEAAVWVFRRESDLFRMETGSRLPVGLAALGRWVDQNTATGLPSLTRAELLALLGRFDEARALVAAGEPGRPFEVYRRAWVEAYSAWRQGNRVDLDRLRSLVAAVGDPDEPDRLLAEGQQAEFESQVRLADGDTGWLSPLAAFRGRVPAAAGGYPAYARRSLLQQNLPLVLALVVIMLLTASVAS